MKPYGEVLIDLRDMLTMVVHRANSADELAAVGMEVDLARDLVLERLRVRGLLW